MSINFTGPAKRIEDIDLPRIGAEIGVGEDPIHALIEVETSGSGFDRQGRPKMLFEPHKFYKHLRKDPEKRARAVREGLAYRDWGMRKYPKDSYPRLLAAMKIDERAALMSASWGMGQIMGENYRMAGYSSVEEMVQAFTEDEDNHLEAMINFVKAAGIDDDLRRIEEKIRRKQKITIADVVPIVRTYNGSGYKRNQYDTRFLNALNRWIRIKDTPYVAGTNMKDIAEAESEAHEHAIATDAYIENVEHDDVDVDAPASTSTLAPDTTEKEVVVAKPTEPSTVPVSTVTPSKESSFKRLWTALGLGGVGIGTFFTHLSGWFKEVDPHLIKWIIFIGIGALVIYLIGQFVNGLFDRWSAHQLNKIQAQSAMNQTVNTVKFVPAESGAKE